MADMRDKCSWCGGEGLTAGYRHSSDCRMVNTNVVDLPAVLEHDGEAKAWRLSDEKIERILKLLEREFGTYWCGRCGYAATCEGGECKYDER